MLLLAGPAASRSPSVREQVAAISALTSKARAAADAGNFSEVHAACHACAPVAGRVQPMSFSRNACACAQALADYTSITRGYPGLALTERARVKRALLLYETGQVQQAIVELDDEEMVLRGNAEVWCAPCSQHVSAAVLCDQPRGHRVGLVAVVRFIYTKRCEHVHRCMQPWQPSCTVSGPTSGSEQRLSGRWLASLTSGMGMCGGWQRRSGGGPGCSRPCSASWLWSDIHVVV